jgi:hypothetical protein
VNGRHHISAVSGDVGRGRTLDRNRGLLHIERRLGSDEAILHLGCVLLLGRGGMGVVSLRGGSGKLAECVRWLERAGLGRVNVRLLAITRWALMNLVGRGVLLLRGGLKLASGDILGEVGACRSARIE